MQTRHAHDDMTHFSRLQVKGKFTNINVIIYIGSSFMLYKDIRLRSKGTSLALNPKHSSAYLSHLTQHQLWLAHNYTPLVFERLGRPPMSIYCRIQMQHHRDDMPFKILL
eukprot:scaffold128637_cov18-Prasinocladus_malaysianus.AAC.1